MSIQATPDPGGAIGSSLSGVSCTASDACTAVGSYNINTSGTVVTLAEAWDGTSWAIQATPNPAGSTLNGLSGVSCAAARSCEAVGYASTPSTLVTLAEAWNGKSWSIQTTPTPAGATGGLLSSVSCTAADVCTAVGYYVNSSGDRVTLAEAWNGTSWTVQTTPNPTGATTSALSGVSCTAADACTAVGSYPGSSGVGATLRGEVGRNLLDHRENPQPSGSVEGKLPGERVVFRPRRRARPSATASTPPTSRRRWPRPGTEPRGPSRALRSQRGPTRPTCSGFPALLPTPARPSAQTSTPPGRR